MAADRRVRIAPGIRRRLTVGGLFVAAVASPWWLVLSAPAAVCAFLLGRGAAPRRVWVVAAVAGAVSAVVARFVRHDQLPFVLLSVAGLAAVISLADGLGRLVHARTQYREQGWQLAAALRDRERAATEAAQTAERSRIAGEMHDSLGHDMALLAMQLAALQVEVQRDGPSRYDLVARLAMLRRAAATATERLHQVIGLLEPKGGARQQRAVVGRSDQVAQGPWSVAVEDCVGRARQAGLDVQLETVDPALDDCPPVVGRTVVRILEEAMTNAAKHAPRSVLRLTFQVDVDAVTLLAVNNRSDTGGSQRRDNAAVFGSGRGLTSLDERARMLGGSCRATTTAENFHLRAEIPLRPVAGGPRVGTVGPGLSRADSRELVARRRQSVLVAPAAIVALGVVAAIVAFVVVNLASVLPRERFTAIEVDQPQAATETLLPLTQMPEAPETVAEPSADCRYYEDRMSFFERTTTFQICFADAKVVAKAEIPAAESR